MHKRKASQSTLFLMELVMVIFIFALCAAVCLGLFSASHRMNDDSDNLNHAVAVSRTAAGCYKAADGDLQAVLQLMGQQESHVVHNTMRIYYDAQWQPTATPVDDGFYLQMTASSDMFAPVQTAEIAVFDMDQTVIFELPVKKAVLHTGGELYGTP